VDVVEAVAVLVAADGAGAVGDRRFDRGVLDARAFARSTTRAPAGASS